MNGKEPTAAERLPALNEECTRLRAELQQAQDRLRLAERIIPAWQDYHGNCSDPDTALQRLTAMMREWRAGR